MSIYDKLFSWQKNIVDSIDKNSYGLFLDMGCGKTPMSLALAEKNLCNNILVITTNSKALEDETVKGSWLQWNRNSNFTYEYSVKNKTNFKESQNNFYITNYQSLFKRNKTKKSSIELNNNIELFIKLSKDKNVAIIIDESHKMKDISSMQTKSINLIKKKLIKVTNNLYCYLLTGTPFTTGYIDLYSQLKFLGYEEIKQKFIDDFCIRGNIPGLLGWQQPIVGYKNIDKLYEVVHQYAITLKSDVVQKLPEQIFIEHRLPLSDDFSFISSEKIEGKKIYEKIKKEYNLELEEYNTENKINNPFYRDIDFNPLSSSSLGRWFADTTGVFWLRCRELSIGFNGNSKESKWFDLSRMNEIENFLKENEDNYVIFYNYTPELIMLYDICDRLGYNIDIYSGEIKSLYFYEKHCLLNKREKFNNRKNVILSNFASGSEGKNWQEYSKCIITSLPLYKDYAQAIKRIHRTGQNETTFYHIFYQNNWLDKQMFKALKEQNNYSLKLFESDLTRIDELIKEEK